MDGFKISTTVILSIIATGAVLNALSSGIAGETPKKIADYIIKGYGSN